jgi:hypothetical protein
MSQALYQSTGWLTCRRNGLGFGPRAASKS